MKTRGILIVLALALTLATPQFTAMPTGIGSAGNTAVPATVEQAILLKLW